MGSIGVARAVSSAGRHDGPTGYDQSFLGAELAFAVPEVADALASNLVEVDGSVKIEYTHFSLALSRSRRLARWVAWNGDGVDRNVADSIPPGGIVSGRILGCRSMLKRLTRDMPTTRWIEAESPEHSDVLWGTLAEPTQANRDSFDFTNIAPQMADFNQSGASGVWVELEDALLASAIADELRLVVMARPVLAGDDLLSRFSGAGSLLEDRVCGGWRRAGAGISTHPVPGRT